MSRGFTLLEILLVMAIAGILVGLATPILFSYQANNDLYLAESSVKQTIRQAETQSLHGIKDDSWGVYIENGKVVLFKGNDYGSRDQDYDLEVSFAENILLSGLNELYFEKGTGIPNTTGTITLSVYDETIDIVINSEGGIE